MEWNFKAFFIAVLSISIFGCATIGERGNRELKREREEKRLIEPSRYEGSLWSKDCEGSFLFSDHKARKIDDTITINIVETTSASNEASTKTEKKSEISMGISNFLGAPLDFNLKNVWGGGRGLSPTLAASTENTFDGSGSTARKGTIIATITARVVEVLPNGNLKIEGRRELTVNQEKQLLVLTGIVRPKDISRDNVVLSSFIADAHISITGQGIISEGQRKGWLLRLLECIWPF
jgi:flagellar L-ring protein precursor FlgH